MSDIKQQFDAECAANIARQGQDTQVGNLGLQFLVDTAKYKYSYNFSWMGRPIIQFPQDMVAMQQLIWEVQPDLVIETGIAHGGSLVYYASLLELNALCGGPAGATVLGIDIDIRAHNREAIESHPMAKRIRMLQGSSIAEDIIRQVQHMAASAKRVMVLLDSNHTHEHVLQELQAYAPLVSVDSYCVVFDTVIEDMPADAFPDRPWGQGDNPKTAVQAYLATTNDFEIDRSMDARLLISVAPSGYLKRTKVSV